MQFRGWKGNNRIIKFELQDMLPGEVFYLPGECVPCRISDYDYSPNKRIEDEHISFWHWDSSPTQSRKLVYHRTTEIIPGYPQRVRNRVMRWRRKEKQRKETTWH